MTTRVPDSPVILEAPGLKLRVLIPAEPMTDAILILLLFSLVVSEFYRPREVIIPTGLAGVGMSAPPLGLALVGEAVVYVAAVNSRIVSRLVVVSCASCATRAFTVCSSCESE